MSKAETTQGVVKNLIGILACAVLVIFLGVVVPYGIVSSENHEVIPQLTSIRFLGPFLIGLGILGYLLCFSSFLVNAQGAPVLGAAQKRLVVKGLYRYVRNPMYLSWFLILLGEGILFRSFDLLFYLMIWIVFFHLNVVFSEEPYLRATFGESYEQYCNSVPRWIPRLKRIPKVST